MHPHLLEAHAIGERLRRLPSECDPPVGWEEFRRRMEDRSPHAADTRDLSSGDSRGPQISARFRSRWRQVALAAGMVIAVAGLAIWGRLSLSTTSAGAEHAAAQAELPMLAMPDKQAFTQAEVSERWLSRLPAEPAVMRVGTRTAVANLEDRIAWMDDVLSTERLDAVDPSHIVALQRERARMVNSLAQVRYAETLVAAAR